MAANSNRRFDEPIALPGGGKAINRHHQHPHGAAAAGDQKV
jgi:hypothetical protein